jgi:twitching motility two-component system response regulator PilG
MGNKKNVLVIDDNLMLLELVEKMLSTEYDVHTVTSAANALNYLNEHPIDIILLDIEMPNVNGFDFLYDIRKVPSYLQVPIIIVSGKTGEDFFKQARNSSAFDVLTKPVKKEILAETIEKALKSST